MSLWGAPIPPIDVLVLDVDGVLFDTRPSFHVAARTAAEEAGGSLTDDEIAIFKRAGGFNDDWEMARAAAAIGRWRERTGSDRSLAALLPSGQGLRGVLSFADDPGDLSARCEALYAQLADREITLVDPTLLRALSLRGVRIRACTGRTRPQAEHGMARLGLELHGLVTCEVARKPDPQALLPLVEDARSALFVGDNVDDLKTAQAARIQLPRSTRLLFAWCLEAGTSEQDATRMLRQGADVATAGIDPLLRAMLDSLGEAWQRPQGGQS